MRLRELEVGRWAYPLLGALCAHLQGSSCGAPEPPRPEIRTAPLITYVGADVFLQIDRFDNSGCLGGAPNGTCQAGETEVACVNDCGTLAADANLFLGADPIDGTASVDRPSCTGCTPPPAVWIDWDARDATRDLPDVFAQKDPSAFPGSDSCVGAANNPQKQELLGAAILSNLQFGYFALTRKDGSGDSAYFWVLTKAQPSQIFGATYNEFFGGTSKTCSATEYLLAYTLVEGDIVLVGSFMPATGADVMRVFRVTAAFPTGSNPIDARSVTDFAAMVSAGFYQEVTGAGEAIAAINTTDTASDAFAGFPGAFFAPLTFSEAAVPVGTLTNSNQQGVCGISFWASAISKPSTSASSDMKDLIGPINTSLGVVTVSPDFHADCETGDESVTASYAVVAYGPGDDTIPLQDQNDPSTTETDPALLMTCHWDFYLGPVAPENLVTASDTCAGVLSLPSGAYTAVVTVTHSESQCESRTADGTVGPVDIVACCPPDSYCSDGDPCTIDDTCVAGVCVGSEEMCLAEELVYFLVVTDVRGAPVGSVRCRYLAPDVVCATLPQAPDDLSPKVLDVRPELTCDYWETSP